MNNLEMAENFIRQSRVRLRYAEKALEEGEYPYVIRQSQESVELALKGVLRLVGILREHVDRFPEWFRENIDEVAGISRELRREREPSMYGDEETMTPSYKLYSRRDAEKALTNARKVLELCEKLFREWYQ
ncbi:MAG: HEPN domain-containing protein [Nitrososphaerota archaeon]